MAAVSVSLLFIVVEPLSSKESKPSGNQTMKKIPIKIKELGMKVHSEDVIYMLKGKLDVDNVPVIPADVGLVYESKRFSFNHNKYYVEINPSPVDITKNVYNRKKLKYGNVRLYYRYDLNGNLKQFQMHTDDEGYLKHAIGYEFFYNKLGEVVDYRDNNENLTISYFDLPEIMTREEIPLSEVANIWKGALLWEDSEFAEPNWIIERHNDMLQKENKVLYYRIDGRTGELLETTKKDNNVLGCDVGMDIDFTIE